jgi:hypothetical protein
LFAFVSGFDPFFFCHPKILWYPAQARLVPWGSPTPGKSICQMQWPENLWFSTGIRRDKSEGYLALLQKKMKKQ